MGDKRIALAEETRERLKERKRGDDTYDDVLQRLLDGEGDDVELGEGYELIASNIASALEAELSIREGVDVDSVAARVVERFDYAALADSTAEKVVRELGA